MSRVFAEFVDWFDAISSALPGRIGSVTRRLWYTARLGKVGSAFTAERGVRITSPATISIGDHVGLGEGCRLSASSGRLSIGSRTKFNSGVNVVADFGEISIGEDVLIAMNVIMRSSNHRFDRSPRVPINQQGHTSEKIEVGNDVWIGAGAVLLPGSKIGDHCVIGASAVVTGEIPPGSVAVGIPAKVVKQLGSNQS